MARFKKDDIVMCIKSDRDTYDVFRDNYSVLENKVYRILRSYEKTSWVTDEIIKRKDGYQPERMGIPNKSLRKISKTELVMNLL
jgi:hypothetical protein